jgi:hypothetical protein
MNRIETNAVAAVTAIIVTSWLEDLLLKHQSTASASNITIGIHNRSARHVTSTWPLGVHDVVVGLAHVPSFFGGGVLRVSSSSIVGR